MLPNSDDRVSLLSAALDLEDGVETGSFTPRFQCWSLVVATNTGCGGRGRGRPWPGRELGNWRKANNSPANGQKGQALEIGWRRGSAHDQPFRKQVFADRCKILPRDQSVRLHQSGRIGFVRNDCAIHQWFGVINPHQDFTRRPKPVWQQRRGFCNLKPEPPKWGLHPLRRNQFSAAANARHRIGRKAVERIDANPYAAIGCGCCNAGGIGYEANDPDSARGFPAHPPAVAGV